ncbi:MAG: DMT family transporter [Burkholderiaceae bacterium]
MANLLALGAIVLWSSLATLGVALSHLPPLLLTALALAIGSIPTWPWCRRWRVAPGALAIGVAGLFGYHLMLFLALRLAPPVQANLLNYLWPLLIVLLSPVFLPGLKLTLAHLVAGLLGLAGATLAISTGSVSGKGDALGYVLAAGAALVWACYSLSTRRLPPYPTAAVGLFALVSAALSFGAHLLLEPGASLSAHDLGWLAAIGLGPMGAAFLLWDAAMKRGDPRTIGVLSYLTPLASTTMLTLYRGEALSAALGLATLLIVGSAALGIRAGRRA